MNPFQQEDWQALLDHVEHRLFVLARDYTVVVANEMARARAEAPLVGALCYEALHGFDEPCASCPSRELLGLPIQKGGSELPPCGLIRCIPMGSADQTRIVVLETEAEDLSIEVNGSDTVLSKLLHSTVDAVLAADPEGTVLVFNEEAERILGHGADQVVGQMHLSRFFPEDQVRQVMRQLSSERYGGKGRLASFAATLQHKDGTEIPVTLRASTLYDGDGELATLWFLEDRRNRRVSIIEDSSVRPLAPDKTSALERLAARITNQVRNPLSGMFLFSNLLMQQLVRRELHRADAFLWNLIQGSVDAIIAADMKGNIFIFNDEAERILGYKSEELVGRAHITKIYRDDEAREVMGRLRSEDHGGKGKLLSHELDLLDKEQNPIPVRLKASIVYINGLEFASVGFFQDQRDRIEMERELKRAQVQLMQSEKMASLGKLSAGIAHQINNPLSGIVLFSNLLLENEDIAGRPDCVADIKRIADDAERCSSIVKELLEFARQTQDAGKPVNLSRAMAQTIFLLEKQPLFHNIEVTKDFVQDQQPIIYGEPQQLNHVFMNLILNAAEAMDGRGTLTLRTAHKPEENAFVVQVGDTGIGISEKHISRVFEPFFTTKEVGKGTGLGLSVVYGIVERHGGSITIDSKVGEGTIFTVTLPVGQAKAE